MTKPRDAHAALPDAVRLLALRLGAVENVGASSVALAQRGTMRDAPGSRWMQFRATQTIDLCRLNFEWRAFMGPFGLISVIDALHDGEINLEVTAFRRLRISSVRKTTAAVKGEIVRYLAELAWSPDAILHSLSLNWSIMDDHILRVSAGRRGSLGEVELRLDADGRIGSVFAPNRPRKEGSCFVERPWQGRFFGYHRHQGRWLPFSGEVGWILDGQEFVVWRG